MSFAIEPSTEIAHRTDFNLLANARGLKIAVEVGVDQGVNAADFLSRFQGNWLILVDPYEPHGDIPRTDRTVDMLVALQALAPFTGRFRFFRGYSLELANHWPVWIGPPEFVYIDGSHTYGDVLSDLNAWWDRITPNGILAGHDFDLRHPGVMQAVTDFARHLGLVVRLTHERHESELKSWYIYRKEPKELVHLFFDSSDASHNPYHQK